MPYATNPSRFDLYCHALGRSLKPGEKVVISDADAELIPTGVFVVSGEDSEKEEPAERPTTRKGGTRGTKPVETTEGVPSEER